MCGLLVPNIAKYLVYAIDTMITRDPKLFARQLSQGLEIAISQGLHKDLTYAAAAAAADSLAAANIADNNNRTSPLSRRARCSTRRCKPPDACSTGTYYTVFAEAKSKLIFVVICLLF